MLLLKQEIRVVAASERYTKLSLFSKSKNTSHMDGLSDSDEYEGDLINVECKARFK